MIYSLTPRQRDAYTFIRGYIAKHGTSPSYEDVKRGLGLASRSSAHRLITGLERRGYIRRLPCNMRSLTLTEAGLRDEVRP